MSRIRDYIEQDKTYIIAEIGQNHQGQLAIAKQLCDNAAKCGVDAIKGVKRNLDACLTDEQRAMPYLNPSSFGATYGEHREALELSEEDFCELQYYVTNTIGLDFISSFTDPVSLKFLDSIGLEVFKVPSQRTVDLKLLQQLREIEKPVIISTGMSSLSDVRKALEILHGVPELYVLQCTSCYPCAEADLNLRCIETLKQFGFPVGLSGHHVGVAPDVAAVVLGARIIERHFTLCRAWKGTDHAASLEPAGMEKIVRYIRQVEEAMGSDRKEILPCEMPALKKLRSDLL